MSRQRPVSSSTDPVSATSKHEQEVATQATKLANDDRHFSMIRQLHLADLITEMNGFCGAMSIFSCLRFCLSRQVLETGQVEWNYSYIYLALTLMPLGLFFDFMDGRVARWRKKSSLLGQELDSLADLISFGMAPASFAFSIGFQTTVDTLLLTFFVLCGLSRLARFNVSVQFVPKDATGKSKYFEGTPIPTSLGVLALLGYWVKQGTILDKLPWGLAFPGTAFEFHYAALIFCLHGCGMVSKSLKVPKP